MNPNLDQPLAAAREALESANPIDHESALRNLVRALDAARGEAVDDWLAESRKAREEMRSRLDAAGAPPAAPRVERYGEGVLVHWPEGVEQYVAVGDCVTAPPAAAVLAGWREHVEDRIRTWRQSFVNRHGDQLEILDFMGSDSLDDLIDYVCSGQVQPAVAVPAGYVSMPVERVQHVIDLLAERAHLNNARSPAHNARLLLEATMTAALVQQPAAAVAAENVTPMRQPRADLARLVESINAAVYANGDGLSVTEAIGALELAKLELLKEQEQ